MDNFEYDKHIFLKSCFSSAKGFKSMKKDQLIATMIINYHRLEKGLSMNNPTPNFGQDSGALERLKMMHKEYLTRSQKDPLIYKSNDKILSSLYHSILEYYNWHKNNNLICKCEWIKGYLNKYKYLELPNKVGGTVHKKKEDILKNINIGKDFFFNRRSIRDYSNKEVDMEVLKDCIKKSLHGTPTVCNRPINKVYIIRDKAIKKQILELQNGNKGFAEQAP
mgnify:CR=1 FL=1|jgi:hypothetical protein